MARKRTERVLVTRVTPDGRTRRPDELIVEEPMTVQLDGVTVTTTMRTPGHDFELATGFCVTEGLLAGATVRGVRYCADDASALDTHHNVVNVETGGRAPTPTPRLGTTSSSCGWCGRDQIDDLVERLRPLPASRIDEAVLAAMPDRVAGEQRLFGATGAVHAAAAFTASGEIVVLREDVGRHNAVDKVVGAMALAGDLPARGRGLFVSGRASVEMVQKAWAGGFGALVAVSAPTALAVTAARRAGLHLVGFVRADTYNVYAEPGAAASVASSDDDTGRPSRASSTVAT